MKLDRKFMERVATSAIAEGLADVVYGHVSTPIGELLVAQTDRGICRISFPGEKADRVLWELAGAVGPRVVESAAATSETREALGAYFEGDDVSLDLRVDFVLVTSEFQRKVLTTLRRVARGHVTTYGQLASRIGHPGAARATGTALGRNPVPIVVPCHRVIQGGGAIGGYGGEPWRKEFLLQLEGALAS